MIEFINQIIGVMKKTIRIREEFRRDGLAFNFLVSDEIMLSIARAFPGSILQVGYPAICAAERKRCEKILEVVAGENIEPALSGHAKQEHIDILAELLNPYPRATANIWIPVSDHLIAHTLKWQPAKVLDHAIKLITYWYENYSPNAMDIALVDCTANEPELAQRIAEFSIKLHQAGARSVVICDTKGYGTPIRLREIFDSIRTNDQESLEFHPHNDSGNGIENVKAAIEYDVCTIGTALLNAGERFSMIDPRQLAEAGIDFSINLSQLQNFETHYFEQLDCSYDEIRNIFSNHTFVTGTQYRLFERMENAHLLFGVTSDAYILSKMLNSHGSFFNVNPDILAAFKDRLYQEKKIFYNCEDLKERI